MPVYYTSATIDGRDLIFGHKLHIGTPYRGKHFLTSQIPTSCLPKSGGIIGQTGNRNLTGPKPLPTIWHTYMKLVTKYQIPVINSCWEKCDDKCAYMLNVYKSQLSRQTGSRNLTTHLTYMYIFRRIFLSKYWWQESDIWSQASYRYPILW
jgi:hypothetical protein